jgi:hypothetical protein
MPLKMVCLLSFLLLIAGGGFAAAADRRAIFERTGGFLIIGALAIIGAGLPLFR